MDRQQFELLTALGSITTFLLGVAVTLMVSPWFEGTYLGYAVVVVVILLMMASFQLSVFFEAYIAGARRLTDELTMIVMSNPNHRVNFSGPRDMRALADKINAFSDRFQTMVDTQEAQIERAQANLEEEKNRLAALMSELTEGVLVCNNEGRILLYNNRAKRLLSQTQEIPPLNQGGTGGVNLNQSEFTPPVPPRIGGGKGGVGGGFVGLGRSVFGLIDRHVITHALEDLTYRSQKLMQPLVVQFVTTATNGQLIRARATPVLGQQHEAVEVLNGFILTLEDVTQQSQRTHRRDRLLQSLTEGIRASLANIRTAIETIEEYPEMDALKLAELRRVIYDESLTLSSRLNNTTAEYAADLKADWQLEEMLVTDLLWAIQRRFEDKLEIQTHLETPENLDLWVRVDSYAIVHIMTQVMRRLKHDFGLLEVMLRLKQTGQLVALDLVWADGLIDMETLWLWQNQNLEPLLMPDITEPATLTLQEVAERHGGEVWCQADKPNNTTYLRLLLPLTQTAPISLSAMSPETTPPIKITHQASRPEYYDFNLFRSASQSSELAQYLLTDLVYTVFDTETTGLDPSHGDEIISASAIRIVNGRLLRQEIFDQLVNPRRPLPAASTLIHGILPEMLENQPTIEQVLPVFFRFTEGTVLVAHNAAFDMRLLQMKEAQTGIKFSNPVLDTLLLSAALHPNYKNHSLEAIAERLGINVIGRHTSLGDAILTGEVFLKLIPLLAEQGIFTLEQAHQVSQKTYQARITY